MAYTTIKKPSDYFNTKLYSGTGSSQAVTGVGFQPDWIWFKSRTNTENHNWFDVVRGSNKIIQSSTSNAEASSTALLTSFDSDGFTVNTDSGVNGSGQTYAAWNWLADNTSGSSNTDGLITSSVSPNTTSGFSIVSYTGTGSNATVGHGLSSAPKMIIFKERNGTRNWRVYHEKMGNAKVMYLNNTDAEVSDSTAFNSTSPTSSVFSVGTSGGTNASSSTYIAYCFAEKQGFSKFGSYVGNGNADGTFVYTGFKPAFIMIKKSSGTENWSMYDTKRNINGTTNTLPLNADNTSIEANNTGKNMDILSNGVKMKTSNGELNLSGETYIYMAIAEEPLVGDNPATAR
jgi:hypothetical protein